MFVKLKITESITELGTCFQKHAYENISQQQIGCKIIKTSTINIIYILKTYCILVKSYLNTHFYKKLYSYNRYVVCSLAEYVLVFLNKIV